MWKIARISSYAFSISAGVLSSYYYQHITKPDVKYIYVIGCKNFSANQIKLTTQQLLHNNKLNLHKLKIELQDIDFIKNIALRIIQPNKLFIHIKEHIPIAQTMDNKIITLDNTIESKSILSNELLKIAYDHPKKIEKLEIEKFVEIIKKFDIKPKICVFVRPGRWNLIVDNKIIKLPEYQITQGLINLSLFIAAHPTHYSFAKIIDLRKTGYVIISNTNINQYLANF